MASVNPRVPYRQQQAAETRRRIAAAGRRLFALQGYSSTSMEALADEVGVAVRTVYASFGTKKAILGAICEAWLEEAHTVTLILEAVKEPDHRKALGLLARASRQQWELGGDILLMLQAAAATDGDISSMLKGWAADRDQGMGRVVAQMAGRLRSGIDPKTANAIVRALTAPDVFQSLVTDSGWSPQQYQDWLAATLTDQLVGGASRP